MEGFCSVCTRLLPHEHQIQERVTCTCACAGGGGGGGAACILAWPDETPDNFRMCAPSSPHQGLCDSDNRNEPCLKDRSLQNGGFHRAWKDDIFLACPSLTVYLVGASCCYRCCRFTTDLAPWLFSPIHHVLWRPSPWKGRRARR